MATIVVGRFMVSGSTKKKYNSGGRFVILKIPAHNYIEGTLFCISFSLLHIFNFFYTLLT